MITRNDILKVVQTSAKAAYCVAFVALAVIVIYMSLTF